MEIRHERPFSSKGQIRVRIEAEGMKELRKAVMAVDEKSMARLEWENSNPVCPRPWEATALTRCLLLGPPLPFLLCHLPTPSSVWKKNSLLL